MIKISIIFILSCILIHYIITNTNTSIITNTNSSSVNKIGLLDIVENTYLKCRSIKGIILLTHSTPSYMINIGIKLAKTGCYYIIVADTCINNGNNNANTKSNNNSNDTFSYIYEYNYTTSNPNEYKSVIKGIEKISNIQIYDTSSIHRLYNRIHLLIIDLKIPFLGVIINSIGKLYRSI